MSKLRIGILGCGGWAGPHAARWEELSARMSVTAVCDPDADQAAGAARRLGAGYADTDYRSLLNHVDAVLIALPHDLHYPAAMTFLEAGKHVLMEQRLAVTEQQCLDLLYASRSRGAVLMTANPMRFDPLVVRLKALLEETAYGDVFQISSFAEHHIGQGLGQWTGRPSEGLGGGLLFGQGLPYIDLLLTLLGKPVCGTHMGTGLGTPWMKREGTSSVSIRFESGAIGMHFGTAGARGTRLGCSIHAHCTEGLLELDLTRRRLYAHTRGRPAGDDGKPPAPQCELLMEAQEDKRVLHDALRHFLDCIEQGKEPDAGAAGSLQGQRVVWRLYEAEAERCVADLRGLGLKEDWSRVPVRHYGISR